MRRYVDLPTHLFRNQYVRSEKIQGSPYKPVQKTIYKKWEDMWISVHTWVILLKAICRILLSGPITYGTTESLTLRHATHDDAIPMMILRMLGIYMSNMWPSFFSRTSVVFKALKLVIDACTCFSALFVKCLFGVQGMDIKSYNLLKQRPFKKMIIMWQWTWKII